MKKSIRLMLALAMCATVFSGCSAKTAAEEKPEAEVTEEAAEENTTESKDKAMLVVSFGTSYNESREATIGAIENAMTEEFTDFDVRRAFTSQIIIDKVESRDGIKIDNVTEAMDKLVADEVKTLVVQPTHVMNGFEYDEMMEAIAPYEEKFEKVSYGTPLLTSDEDYAKVIDILTDSTAEYNEEGTAVVFMGHGTEHPANATYKKLGDMIKDAGHDNYFVGTVEATPSVDDIIADVAKTDAKKVVLLPLMIVAGDHANNDMAGDEEDSWKTKFKAEGYEVEPVLKGLGEYSAIQEMFVAHASDAVANLGE